MQDYESGEGLSEEEDANNLVMFTCADLVTFEEVVKSAKWRDAIDLEIEVIERNQTWELTSLPAGVKWVFKTKLN